MSTLCKNPNCNNSLIGLRKGQYGRRILCNSPECRVWYEEEHHKEHHKKHKDDPAYRARRLITDRHYRKTYAKYNRPLIRSMYGYSSTDNTVDVHHIDRDKRNNTITNLIALQHNDHARITHRHKDAYTDILDYEVLSSITRVWYQ